MHLPVKGWRRSKEYSNLAHIISLIGNQVNCPLFWALHYVRIYIKMNTFSFPHMLPNSSTQILYWTPHAHPLTEEAIEEMERTAWRGQLLSHSTPSTAAPPQVSLPAAGRGWLWPGEKNQEARGQESDGSLSI